MGHSHSADDAVHKYLIMKTHRQNQLKFLILVKLKIIREIIPKVDDICPMSLKSVKNCRNCTNLELDRYTIIF